MMETETKCMMCFNSLECTLTRNARDLCEGPHENSFYSIDHVGLLKLNLRGRLKHFFQEKKLKLTTGILR